MILKIIQQSLCVAVPCEKYSKTDALKIDVICARSLYAYGHQQHKNIVSKNINNIKENGGGVFV